jgi:hypothetical protein
MELKDTIEKFGPGLLSGLVGGILALYAAWITIERDEEYASNRNENRLTKVEESIPNIHEAIKNLRDDLAGLEGSIDSALEQYPSQVSVEAIGEKIASISERLTSLEASVEEYSTQGNPISLDELAALIVAKHSEELRGPKGETGEKGPQGDDGLPGKDGSPGDRGENGSAYILTDADVRKIAAEVVESLPSFEPANNSNEQPSLTEENSSAKYVGATDCFELDPNTPVTVIEFKLGGAACLKQLPVLEIVKAEECILWVSEAGSRGRRIEPSVRESVYHGDGYLNYVYECDASFVGKDGLPKYTFRLFW